MRYTSFSSSDNNDSTTAYPQINARKTSYTKSWLGMILVLSVILVGAAAWTHASTTNQNENLLQTKMALRNSGLKIRSGVSGVHAMGLKHAKHTHMPTVSRCTKSHALTMPDSYPKGAFSPKTLSHPTANHRQVAVNSLFGLGLPELLVIGAVGALVFGPSKLPELGKQLGTTAKSLGAAVKEFNEELKDELQTGEENADDAGMASKKDEEKKE